LSADGSGWWGRLGNDRRLLLMLCGAMLAVIVVVSVLAPPRQDDPRPTTTNSGPRGAKAAYLLLERLGRGVSRWERPLVELSDLDASRTTLVLAEPLYGPKELKEMKAALEEFMKRGGRVVTTGETGAALLPGGATKGPGMFEGNAVCYTTPEGPGELARTGRVEMEDDGQWAAEGVRFRVEQRCGGEAVVVRFAVGKGEAVWWSSATAMTNAGLKQDADLRLLLASVGAGRDVVFDESVFGQTKTLWDAAKGLPLGWLSLQVVVLGVLVVVSFSRRRGPVRMPVVLPRSSPVEFAESMGDLYEKGGANIAATDAAKRRLVRVLVREAGLAQTTVAAGPEAVAEALRARLGGEWGLVAVHLKEADGVAREKESGRAALALVRGLGEDAEAVRAKLRR
jgi:hypothetical protein